MKSYIVKLSVLGLAGAVFLQMNTMHVDAMYAKAAVLPEGQSIAGVSVSLEQYFGDDTSAKKVDEADGAMKIAGITTLVAVNNVVEETEKDIELNLNYDRLGIAKVDNYLNIRAKASEDSKIVGHLPKNAGCNVYKITKDGWAKIKSGKVTGYVKSEYLILDEEAEEYALKVAHKKATVLTETLNVRFLPDTDASIYTLVPIDEQLDVVKENLTEEYVNRFIEKHFTGEDKALIKDVDQKEMMDYLKDWLCVKIDNEKVFVAKEFVEISYELEKAVPEKEEKITKASSQKDNGQTGTDQVASVRSQMVSFAKQYLGNRYVFGGTSLTNGIDCSGFMMRIYQHFGYSIPRDSRSQAAYCTKITLSEAKPGDLIFYGNGSYINHVAMYIGSGQVIHASNPSSGIKISNASYRTPMKVGRIIRD